MQNNLINLSEFTFQNGILSAFSLFGNSANYEKILKMNDTESLRSDWRSVGSDLSKSIEIIVDEQEPSKKEE